MASCVQIISIILLTLESTRAAPLIESDTDLWTNPCFANTTSTTHRRGRSTAERELNTFAHILDKTLFAELEELYPNNTELTHRLLRNSSCPNIYNMIKHIKANRSEKNNKTIGIRAHQKRFHIALIHLYKYLDKLQNVRIHTSAEFDSNKRTMIYEKTKNLLRLTICEFKETFHRNFRRKPRKPKTQCVPDEANLNDIQSWDIQYFLKLNKFLRFGKNKLKNWTHPKNPPKNQQKNHQKNKKVRKTKRTQTNSS